MAYLLPRCLILHVPKTGSKWIRDACQASVQGPIREVGPWHCDLETARAELGGRLPLTGTFVRDPLGWYRSAWLYWKETGRYPRVREEPLVESDDFEQFVHNCMHVAPGGYVTTLFEKYTGCRSGEVGFVGRQETLADDLVRFLQLAGEEFDESALRATQHVNVGGARGPVSFPGYSQQLATEVRRHEHRAMRRFGYFG